MNARRFAHTTIPEWKERYVQLASEANNCYLKDYYAAGMVAANTPVSQLPMVALDFETTGLNPEQDEIISIGLVPFDHQRVYCRKAREWLVKPSDSLSQQSVVIHGIRHSDLSEAPDLLHILNDVLPALSGRVIVVHYQRIERQFMARELLRRIGESIDFPVIDTMALEHQQLRQHQSWQDKLFKRPLPSVRLGECRQRYRLPFYHPHHALTDAIATAELLQAQLAHHFSPDTPVSELWHLE
ncbi:MAG: DNA polymerase III subunit epsilon [Oceanospirillaceae bacterium]|nr:DNA polymerase III subunit epsilon [Oceanospirillaceae bacterium]